MPADVFKGPFHISSTLLIGCLQSDPRSHYLHALTSPLVEYFASPTPNFYDSSSVLLIEGLDRFCQEDIMRPVCRISCGLCEQC